MAWLPVHDGVWTGSAGFVPSRIIPGYEGKPAFVLMVGKYASLNRLGRHSARTEVQTPVTSQPQHPWSMMVVLMQAAIIDQTLQPASVHLPVSLFERSCLA